MEGWVLRGDGGPRLLLQETRGAGVGVQIRSAESREHGAGVRGSGLGRGRAVLGCSWGGAEVPCRGERVPCRG